MLRRRSAAKRRRCRDAPRRASSRLMLAYSRAAAEQTLLRRVSRFTPRRLPRRARVDAARRKERQV